MEDKVIARPALAQERRVLVARGARAASPVVAVSEIAVDAPISQLDVDPHASCRAREAALADTIRQEIALELAADAESQRARAQEEGFKQGWREGSEKAIGEAREAEAVRLQAIASLTETITRTQEAALEDARDAALAIGFAAACRILGAALVTKPGVLAAIDQVVAHAHANERLTVRLAPADRALLDIEGVASEGRVEYVADTSMERGGCFVESSAGTLDGRLRTQIEALYDALRRAQAGEGA